MDTLLVLLMGIIAIAVVIGAIMAGKKKDPLGVQRSRRDDLRHARPVFLSHDQHWKPAAEEPETETVEEADTEETTAAR